MGLFTSSTGAAIDEEGIRIVLKGFTVKALALVGISFLTLLAVPASVAYAAGSGYTPTSTGGGVSVPGGFGSIACSQTVVSASAVVSCQAGTSSINVNVPASSFSIPTIISVTTGSASQIGSAGVTGYNAVLAIGVDITQNGQKYQGTISPPLTVTISDPSITSTSQIVMFDTSSQSWVSVPGASVSNGKVTLSITSDPDFAVLAQQTSATVSSSSAPTSSVSGATSVTTGKPFLLEGSLAGVLIIAGILVLWISRRRTLVDI